MWETLSPSSVSGIIRLYREAIDMDPSNGGAFAGLALALVTGAMLGTIHAPFAYASAEAAVSRAVEVGPQLPEVRWAQAWIKLVLERDWIGAQRLFDDALKQFRFCMSALIGRGLLYVAEGRLENASDCLQKASDLTPLNTPATALLCWTVYLSGNYDQAVEGIEQARAVGHHGDILDSVEALSLIQIFGPDSPQLKQIETMAAESPHHYTLLGVLGYAYGIIGQVLQARRILVSLGNDEKKDLNPYATALTLIGLNEPENAVRCLQRSYEQGSLWSLGFQCDPILSRLQGNENYLSLLTLMNYPVDEVVPARGRKRASSF